MVRDRAFAHLRVPCGETFILVPNFDILTFGFDEDGNLWNLPRTGAFVFHNTSCFLLLIWCISNTELLWCISNTEYFCMMPCRSLWVVTRVAERLRKDLMILLICGFQSHCGMWVPVLRMRPYKPRSSVAAGPSLLKGISAKHRSKFAALSSVMLTASRLLKNCSGDYRQTNKQITLIRLYLSVIEMSLDSTYDALS
jgi:hypothetical protein